MTTDPFTLFDDWYEQARLNEVNDSNAMALATADAQGRPSVRMVLLKGHGPDGFVFYTNYEGRKAADLFANPHAALLLHWKSLRRQIRIEGPVEKVSEQEGDAYFATRSRDSQLGAWASDQSRPLDNRHTFEARFDEVQARCEGQGAAGFGFLTNYVGREAGGPFANPHAALLHHGKSRVRQIRIEGPVEKVRGQEGDAYFATRSRDSQLGAWASDQSRPLDNRHTFEARFEEVQARFEGQEVPRPPHWSGFRVIPERIEFWQDREHRLHERRLFVRERNGWTESLLYP